MTGLKKNGVGLNCKKMELKFVEKYGKLWEKFSVTEDSNRGGC